MLVDSGEPGGRRADAGVGGNLCDRADMQSALWPTRFGTGIGIRSSVSLPHPCSPPHGRRVGNRGPRRCRNHGNGVLREWSGRGRGGLREGGVRVVVVGAGPAGVGTALLLARYGVEVVLVERE